MALSHKALTTSWFVNFSFPSSGERKGINMLEICLSGLTVYVQSEPSILPPISPSKAGFPGMDSRCIERGLISHLCLSGSQISQSLAKEVYLNEAGSMVFRERYETEN